ncbi:MAG: polysaccharide biosynthesis/export family protein [Polyangiaceae bacterium]
MAAPKKTGTSALAVHLLAALLLSVMFLGACGGPEIIYDPANYRKESNPAKHEYIIGVSDTLQVNVWRNPEVSSAATVRPDGTITLPLLGDVKVEGRTPTEVKNEVTKRLSAYVKDESAVVTVAITGVNSYRFTVAGNCARPGIFTTRYYVTVAEAIAMAGGPTRFADTEQVILVRTDPNGRVRQIPINYDSVRSRDNPEQDLVLVTGDTVFLP